MKVTSGRVVDGKIVVDGEPLIEGTVVTVVIDDTVEEAVDVTPEEEEALLASMAEIERGEFISAEQLLHELRRTT